MTALLRNISPPSSPDELSDLKFTAASTFWLEYKVDPDIVPVVVKVDPSNVKADSALIVPPPLSVNTLLLAVFVIAGVMFEAVLALIALNELEALAAKEALEIEPVIVPSTFNEPEIVTVLAAKSPPIKGVPEPELM